VNTRRFKLFEWAEIGRVVDRVSTADIIGGVGITDIISELVSILSISGLGLAFRLGLLQKTADDFTPANLPFQRERIKPLQTVCVQSYSDEFVCLRAIAPCAFLSHTN